VFFDKSTDQSSSGVVTSYTYEWDGSTSKVLSVATIEA
jgi:hypothetical protein